MPVSKKRQADLPGTHDEASDTLRVRFRGELLELTPTTEYPLQLLQTGAYETWIEGIADSTTKARVTNHVARMRRGLLGDWKEVGGGIWEMRLDFGPGYRVYYARHGKVIIILLGGGEKSGQQKDIAHARKLWGELKDDITQV